MTEYNPSDLTRTFRTKVTVCDCSCWLFARTDRYGYGQFKHNGRNKVAHRFAYERLVGPIPDDMTVDHLCDRHRNCVNPAHMELVTRAENSIRANARRKAQGGYGSGPTQRPANDRDSIRPNRTSEAHDRVTEVACPFCSAPIGEPCTTKNNKPAMFPHQDRVRASVLALGGEWWRD